MGHLRGGPPDDQAEGNLPGHRQAIPAAGADAAGPARSGYVKPTDTLCRWVLALLVK